MDKCELRNLIRERKRGLTAGELEEMSIPIIRRLLANPAVRNAGKVLMYCSLPDEVNTYNALTKLKEMGKTVVLPRVIDHENMELTVYDCADCLAVGPYGIKEATGETFSKYDDIDVAIIPGLAFDKYNNRLGRGKGYYDRLLAKMPHTYKIGICFDFQKVDEIPTNNLDICMNEII
ncbi:MAG: 5-formyltetrahydrofolate cyclo-ligase [Prevotella sp.]|nr:5-formyltetrahydrofolate cyclo-ligase [Prevotella sp.]